MELYAFSTAANAFRTDLIALNDIHLVKGNSAFCLDFPHKELFHFVKCKSSQIENIPQIKWQRPFFGLPPKVRGGTICRIEKH